MLRTLFQTDEWSEELREKWLDLKYSSACPAGFATLVEERIDLFIAEHYRTEEKTENA